MTVNFKTVLLFFFLTSNTNLIGQEVKILDKDIPVKIDVRSLLKENPSKSCIVPLTYDVSNSGSINKLTNIGNAETLKVDNNGGTINQTFVFVEVSNQTYLSPQKSEAQLRGNFETNTGIKVEHDLLQKVDDLKEEINLWKGLFQEYVSKLDKLQDDDPKKLEGYKILEKYRDNIKTAVCLEEDYKEEAIVEKDKTGRKSYLFNLEKIKNNPSYLFIGEKNMEFRIVQKFNKCGYLSSSPNYEDIPFIYKNCKKFTSNYAIVNDQDYYYILNKFGNEVLKFGKKNIASVIDLYDGKFLIKGCESRYHKCKSYIINITGEVISKKYDYIKQLNQSKKYFEAYNFINNYNIKSYLINKYGSEVMLFSIKCKNNINDYFKTVEGCNFVTIFSALHIPNTELILFIGAINNMYHKSSHSKFFIKDFSLKDSIVFSESFPESIPLLPSSELLLIQGTPKYNPTKDFIIGIDNYLNNAHKILINNDGLETKDISIKLMKLGNSIRYKVLYNLSKKRRVGDEFINIFEQMPKHKLLRISVPADVNGSYKESQGIIDYYGAYIVPPLFKKISYDESEHKFEIIDYNDIVYKIDLEGNCYLNCKKYYTIFKMYYKAIK